MANTQNINPILIKRLEKFFFDENITNVKYEQLDLKNFLGVMFKVIARKNDKQDGQVDLSYIFKVAPSTDALRKYAQIDKLFKKEIFVYEKLLPLYQQLSLEHNIYEEFVNIPKIYFTCNETLQESLLMDNMTLKGYQSWDFNKNLDLPHAIYVMKTYGKLHALSYALREYKPNEYKKIVEYTKEKFNANINIAAISNQQKKCCKKAFETLNPTKDRRAIQLFSKFMEKPFEYQLQAMKMGAIGSYAVITHGDASLKNFLFKYDNHDDATIPSDLCILDWQYLRYGSPAFDLSQFIFIFTDKTFRKNHLQQLLKAYHYSLCSHLSEFGLDPEKVLPFDVLQMEMKRYSIFGLCMAIMVLHIVLEKEGDVIQLPTGAKTSDIDDIFDTSVRNDDYYKGRVRDVITDFVEYGYFELVN
nr:uncharacterized protein LOC111418825 [Onthophagus taurus]